MTDSATPSVAPRFSFRGLMAFRKRRPNLVTFLIALAIYLAVSRAIILSAGDPDIRFRVDLSEFLSAALALKIHVASAVASFGIGIVLLAGAKGRTFHKVLGYTWVVTMLTTAISSFFLMELNHGKPSLIHGLSAWLVIGLPFAVAAARRKDIRKHAKEMTGMFTGAMLVASLFAFLPGRMMWSIFFAA